MSETKLISTEQAEENHMGRMKEMAIEQQEQAEMQEDEQAAQQEAYYWHCISEFYGMLKYFGVSKVMADLETFKKTVEKRESDRMVDASLLHTRNAPKY